MQWRHELDDSTLTRSAAMSQIELASLEVCKDLIGIDLTVINPIPPAAVSPSTDAFSMP